jgi:hypothetical protein
MEYSLKKINNEIIKPVKVDHIPIKNIKGWQIIPVLFFVLYVIGKKGSGKTNIINHVIKNKIDKNTKVIVFGTTHNSCEVWKKIKKKLEKNNIENEFYNSIVDGKTNNLDNLLKTFQENDAAEQQKIKDELKDNKEIKEEYTPLIDVEVLKYKKKKKYIKLKIGKKLITPKYLIIFDDISHQLKTKDVSDLIKTLRHFKCAVIVSSQYPNDLELQARMQVDIECIFKGFDQEKIEEIFPQLNLPMLNKKEFYALYYNITKNSNDHKDGNKNNYIYIDRNNEELRKNFNEKIILTKKN